MKSGLKIRYKGMWLDVYDPRVDRDRLVTLLGTKKAVANSSYVRDSMRLRFMSQSIKFKHAIILKDHCS